MSPFSSLTRERLLGVLSAIPDTVVLIDTTLTLQFVNNPKEQGYTAQDAVGTPALEFIAPGHRDSQREILLRVLETGEPTTIEYPLLTGDGDVEWFEGTMSPLEEDDMVVGVVLISRNVTDRHLAEEEAERLRKLVPICSWCGRIRRDDGYWAEVEAYIEERSGERVTHGICPECEQKVGRNGFGGSA